MDFYSVIDFHLSRACNDFMKAKSLYEIKEKLDKHYDAFAILIRMVYKYFQNLWSAKGLSGNNFSGVYKKVKVLDIVILTVENRVT